jgi:hypothetical protein
LMVNKPIIWLGLFKSDGRLSGKCVEVRLSYLFCADNVPATDPSNGKGLVREMVYAPHGRELRGEILTVPTYSEGDCTVFRMSTKLQQYRPCYDFSPMFICSDSNGIYVRGSTKRSGFT